MGTQDQYPVGALYGKYKDRTEYLNHHYMLPGLAVELSGSYWDVFLPLQGRNSIVHRAMVLQRYASLLNMHHDLRMIYISVAQWLDQSGPQMGFQSVLI